MPGLVCHGVAPAPVAASRMARVEAIRTPTAALARDRKFVVRPLIVHPPFAPDRFGRRRDDHAEDLLRSPYGWVTAKKNGSRVALSSCANGGEPCALRILISAPISSGTRSKR